MTFSSDVIHPRVQGGPEAGFVETWAERKAKRPIKPTAPPVARPRKTTPEALAKFKRLYLSGMTYDKMVIELGIGRTTLDRYREELDLPRRHARRGKKYRRLAFRLTVEDYAALKTACRGRHRSVADLMRSLIRARLS